MNLLNFKKLITLKYSFLTVITGPMFSGKTESLLFLIKQYSKAKKIFLVFKPQVDKRFSQKEITSHKNISFSAIPVNDSQEIITKINETSSLDAIFIDEVHFFNPELSKRIDKLLIDFKKLHIFVSGLNKGFSDHELPLMNKLLNKSDFLIKLTAICDVCGEIATKTQAIDENQNPISPQKFHGNYVGGEEKYQARCRNCYEFFSWSLIDN